MTPFVFVCPYPFNILKWFISDISDPVNYFFNLIDLNVKALINIPSYGESDIMSAEYMRMLLNLLEAGSPTVGVSGNIPEDEEIERSAGNFLVTSRYMDSNDRYKILKKVSPQTFFQHFNLPTTGNILVSEMSDLLVRAFDTDFAFRLFPELEDSVLWAFQDLDGRTIHQHST